MSDPPGLLRPIRLCARSRGDAGWLDMAPAGFQPRPFPVLAPRVAAEGWDLEEGVTQLVTLLLPLLGEPPTMVPAALGAGSSA